MALELITTLRELNNPTKEPQMYADKLNRLGLPIPVTHIVNPVITMVAWLRRYAADAKVFVIGEDALIRAVQAAGIEATERADEIDIVIAFHALVVASIATLPVRSDEIVVVLESRRSPPQ